MARHQIRKGMKQEEIMDVLWMEREKGDETSYTEVVWQACAALDRDDVQKMHEAIGSPYFGVIPLPSSAPQPRGLQQRAAVDGLFTATGEELGKAARIETSGSEA